MTKHYQITFSLLREKLENLLLRDKQYFLRYLHKVSKIKNYETQKIFYERIIKRIDKATDKILLRKTARPSHISYPINLPISEKKQFVLDFIQEHQIVIVSGETGSGKTTQLPKICMELGYGIKGYIGHTQPRRLAAKTIASHISKELQTELGECVGYKVRFSETVSDKTLIKLMTDGMFLTEIQHDRLLTQYDVIIIDEAHERNLNIDFLLGYIKEILPYRPDLKIIITSATINLQSFSRHFDNAPIIEIPGRSHPIEIRYRPIMEKTKNTKLNQLKAISKAIDELWYENLGDILIFMSSEQEINDTAHALRKRYSSNIEVLPLYSLLPDKEQSRVFSPCNKRRIVLATNIAETSLTVPGIKHVIDLGTARVKRYNFRKKVHCLPIEAISQASANQRSGRCGRTSKGICIRLYSEEDFLSRKEFPDPEILRSNLASVILQMFTFSLGDITKFPFIDAPNNRNIKDGIHFLKNLGAINNDGKTKNYKLTPLGHQISKIPIDPHLSRTILEANKYNCVQEVIIIVSALSTQDLRENLFSNKQKLSEEIYQLYNKESDFLTFVNLWNYLNEHKKTLSLNQFQNFCYMNRLNYHGVREWKDIYTQLSQIVRELRISINDKPAKYREIHIALLIGFLPNIGMKEERKQEFIGAHNIRFFLSPKSSLFNKKLPKWIMVANLLETSRLWGHIAARIEPEWIELVAPPHLLRRSYKDPHWEQTQGAVIATEKVTIFGLLIVTKRKVHYNKIDPVLCRELFIRHALINGNWKTNHVFFHKNLKLREEIEGIEHKIRRRNIMINDETLYKFYDSHFDHNIVSVRHFDNWWKEASRKTPNLLDLKKSILLKDEVTSVNMLNYPDFWCHDNLKLRLSYRFDPGTSTDGVTVHVPLFLLNQIDESSFEWQIPGFRYELVISLIKSLPKSVRRNFVPVQSYAEAFLKRSTPFKKSLLDSLEHELYSMTGITIDRKDWQWDRVPDYLKIIFCVLDDKGKKLQEGRSLSFLRQLLNKKTQEVLLLSVNDNIERSNLRIWDFEELPKFYEKQRNYYKVIVWPALVDEKDSVSIRIFDNQQKQKQAMKCGLRRLLLLNSVEKIKYLHKNLFNELKFNFYFSFYGRTSELIDDCISCGVDEIVKKAGGVVWKKEDFFSLHKKILSELNDIVTEIALQVEQILSIAFSIQKQLKKCANMQIMFAFSDIKMQLDSLVYRGFITENGFHRLGDTFRYLQAIEKRLEKIIIDPYQDYAKMIKVKSVQEDWKLWLNKLPMNYHENDKVQEIRWMIEELRVSLFAQNLGTAYPISDKRILQTMKQILK